MDISTAAWLIVPTRCPHITTSNSSTGTNTAGCRLDPHPMLTVNWGLTAISMSHSTMLLSSLPPATTVDMALIPAATGLVELYLWSATKRW